MGEAGVMLLTTESADETKDAAATLAPLLRVGDVVAFSGDLGAGKTQFVQGVARGLGVTADVTSPTFNILLEYPGGRLPLYHFDLYRLDDAEQLEDVDFYGTLEGDGVTFVEWSEKFPDELPEERLELAFTVRMDGSRALEACGVGARGTELLEGWREALGR